MSEVLTTIGFVHADGGADELKRRYYDVLSTLDGVELHGSPDSFPRFTYEDLLVRISAPDYFEEEKTVTPDLPCLLLSTQTLATLDYETAVGKSDALADLVAAVYDRLVEKPDIVYGMGPGQVHWCSRDETNPYPIDSDGLAEHELNLAAWLFVLPRSFRARYDADTWRDSGQLERLEELDDGGLLVVLGETPTEGAAWKSATRTLGLPGLDR